MRKLKDFFVNLIDTYPINFGIFFLVLGILVFAYQIRKKESFNMNNHDLFAWKAFVNTWAVALILVMFGIILLIRNF